MEDQPQQDKMVEMVVQVEEALVQEVVDQVIHHQYLLHKVSVADLHQAQNTVVEEAVLLQQVIQVMVH